jgi:hypothetical protein
VIINLICASTCTQYSTEVAVPVPNNNGFGAGPDPIATVQDVPYSLTPRTTGIIGIAGPPAPPSQPGSSPVIFYSAGQTVPVVVNGAAACSFDTQVTGGDYVVASPNNGGYCASAGTTMPASGQILGIALGTNGMSSFGAPFAQTIILGAGH